MSGRLSRRKLAVHAAERLLAGDGSVVDELAAMLTEEKRGREADILVRDIEAELARHGVLVATVETAKGLSAEAKAAVEKFLNASGEVLLREIVKPELIGGIKIVTPTQEFDGTIAKKLTSLRTRK